MLNLFMWLIHAYKFSFYIILLTSYAAWHVMETLGPRTWNCYRNVEGIIRITLLAIYEVMLFTIVAVICETIGPIIVIITAIRCGIIDKKPSIALSKELYAATYNEVMDILNKTLGT